MHTLQFQHFGDQAWQSLLDEVNLTPKPGLVDRCNNGAHQDMALDDFYRSAAAIRPWLPRFIACGFNAGSLAAGVWPADLRELGIACERDMFRATYGVNTHKGCVFALGVMCCALGRLLAQQRLPTQERLCRQVAHLCQGLVKRELQEDPSNETAGQRLFHLHGFGGARAEAESGFTTVLNVGLPAYRQARQVGMDQQQSLLTVLLNLMRVNVDTNVVARGGLSALDWLQQRAAAFLDQGGLTQPDAITRLQELDNQCIARRLSPGGSADLLVITRFLTYFPTQVIPLINKEKIGSESC